VRRADETDIDQAFGLVADGQDAAFLQDPRQPDLRRRGKLAEFVEEQGAAVGLREDAVGIAHGAGECALAMAEQGGVDQLGRNGATIR